MTIKPANIRLGCNMKHALDFANRCQSWQTFSISNHATREAIKRLEAKGLIKTNQFNQFRKA